MGKEMAGRQCLHDRSRTYINKEYLRLFLRGKIDCALVAFSCRIASPVYPIYTLSITVNRLLAALFNRHIFSTSMKKDMFEQEKNNWSGT